MAKDESPSLVKLLGALFASALATALIAGALAAARLQGASLALSFLVSSAAFALPALVVVALVRLAAASLGGPRNERFRPVLLALSLSSATLFVLALALGRVLRANTHHTGLAGTTFAVICAVLALGIVPLGIRLAGSMQRWQPARQGLLVAAASGATLIMLAMALARVHHAILAGELGFVAAVPADATTLLVLGVVVSLAQIGRLRPLAVLAPPLFVALLVVGVSVTRSHPDLSSALAERSLFAARCSTWLVR